MTLLRDVIERRNPELSGLLDRLGVVRLTTEEREALRYALADELCESGLGPDDEHNEFGLELDDLIGALGRM
ncbi:MAG TPA: hypothetical protein VJ253_06315 [Dehalococcoidia bacterium]|nr:hypothetical protein [Dehalococcoidia bacterium]